MGLYRSIIRSKGPAMVALWGALEKAANELSNRDAHDTMLSKSEIYRKREKWEISCCGLNWIFT